MHIPTLTSRWLYFIHPPLQVPPEWECLENLRVGGVPPPHTWSLLPVTYFPIHCLGEVRTSDLGLNAPSALQSGDWW